MGSLAGLAAALAPSVQARRSELYFDGGGTFTKDRAMTLAYGRAYGGSTVVYTGTSLTMPEEVLDRVPADQHGILVTGLQV